MDMTPIAIRPAEFDRELQAAMKSLKAFALSLTRSGPAADDLVQDTVLRILRFPDNFQPGTSMKAWAFTIMRNIFIDGIRAAKRTPLSMDDEELASFMPVQSATQLAKVELDETMAAMAKLSEAHSEIILLALSGRDYDAMAEHLGIPTGTVRSRLARARRHLREATGA